MVLNSTAFQGLRPYWKPSPIFSGWRRHWHRHIFLCFNLILIFLATRRYLFLLREGIHDTHHIIQVVQPNPPLLSPYLARQIHYCTHQIVDCQECERKIGFSFLHLWDFLNQDSKKQSNLVGLWASTLEQMSVIL